MTALCSSSLFVLCLNVWDRVVCIRCENLPGRRSAWDWSTGCTVRIFSESHTHHFQRVFCVCLWDLRFHFHQNSETDRKLTWTWSWQESTTRTVCDCVPQTSIIGVANTKLNPTSICFFVWRTQGCIHPDRQFRHVWKFTAPTKRKNRMTANPEQEFDTSSHFQFNGWPVYIWIRSTLHWKGTLDA